LLDMWGSNLVEGWMDVMVPPKLVNSVEELFPSFARTIHVQDVQADIDENERQRELMFDSQDFFSAFQTYGAISAWLTSQSVGRQDARRVSIGESYNGNPIHALQIGVSGSPKPTFVIQCGIHAREWIAPSSCCWIINQLLNEDEDRNTILSKFDFVIIPVLNVDGYDYTHTTNRLWRKNRQPTPGSICIGTDLNRNFDYAWSGPGASPNPCSDTFYGPSAFSGPEAAAVRDLLQSLAGDGHLLSYIDIHAYGAMWMSPWGYTCNELPQDYPLLDRFMRASASAIREVSGRNYVTGAACPVVYMTSGDCVDYSYGDTGAIHSYAIEVFGNSFTPNPSQIPIIGGEMWAGVKQTCLLIP